MLLMGKVLDEYTSLNVIEATYTILRLDLARIESVGGVMDQSLALLVP